MAHEVFARDFLDDAAFVDCAFIFVVVFIFIGVFVSLVTAILRILVIAARSFAVVFGVVVSNVLLRTAALHELSAWRDGSAAGQCGGRRRAENSASRWMEPLAPRCSNAPRWKSIWQRTKDTLTAHVAPTTPRHSSEREPPASLGLYALRTVLSAVSVDGHNGCRLMEQPGLPTSVLRGAQ